MTLIQKSEVGANWFSKGPRQEDPPALLRSRESPSRHAGRSQTHVKVGPVSLLCARCAALRPFGHRVKLVLTCRLYFLCSAATLPFEYSVLIV